jgi:MFS family permease
MEERVQASVEDTTTSASSLISWGPVFAGAVIGLGLAVMVSALWFALAFDRGTAAFRNYLEWWLAGTAIGATLVGAFIAGLTSARRGRGSGLLEGLTLWGVLVIVLLTVGTSAAAIFGTTFNLTVNGTTYTITTTTYWSVFWTLLSGFGAAALGGILGGSIPRRGRREREPAGPMPSPFADEEPSTPVPPPVTTGDSESVITGR